MYCVAPLLKTGQPSCVKVEVLGLPSGPERGMPAGSEDIAYARAF